MWRNCLTPFVFAFTVVYLQSLFCLSLPLICSYRHTDTHTLSFALPLSHIHTLSASLGRIACLLYRRNEDLLAVCGQAARERRTHETVVADTERQLDVMRARVERDGHGNLVADLFISCLTYLPRSSAICCNAPFHSSLPTIHHCPQRCKRVIASSANCAKRIAS